MRICSIALLSISLVVVTGCASAPKMTAAKSKPITTKATEKPSNQFLAAKRYEKQGKPERARQIYEEILEKDPQNLECLHRLAVVCTQLQRYAEAVDYYQQAQKLDSKNPVLLADLGYSYYLSGDLPEAERALRKALVLKPSYTKATNNLALVVGVQGNLEESLTLLQKVGSEAEARSSMAYIYLQRGEPDRAEASYREALAIDPDLKSANRGLATLTKDKMPTEATMAAKSKSATSKDKMADDDDFMPETPKKKSSAIRQASALEDDDDSQKVVTADYTREAKSTREPSLLTASFEDLESDMIDGPDPFSESKIEFDEGSSEEEEPKPKKTIASKKKPAKNEDFDFE